MSVAVEDLVGAADTLVLVRETIRACAFRHGLQASFSPKMIVDGAGNGGHLHLSLWRDDRNLFSGGEGQLGLTAEAEAFTAGVLSRLPALLAIGAPSPASYLRLIPQHWAGAFQAWGLENRETALRVVRGAAGSEGRAANLEVKAFDLAANPYLAVAAVVFAGLAGIDGGERLPQPVRRRPCLVVRGRTIGARDRVAADVAGGGDGGAGGGRRALGGARPRAHGHHRRRPPRGDRGHRRRRCRRRGPGALEVLTPVPDLGEDDAPLLVAWRAAVDSGRVPFTIPGHKGRAGEVWPTLGRLLSSDVPLFGGLAPVKEAPAALAAAEARAAQLWGADRCWFTTGGSTQANQIAALALGRPGDTVLVGRTAHRSTLTGLVLAGLEPVWVPVDDAGRLDVVALRALLAAHPSAAGVFLVDPGYRGARSDLAAVVRAAHDARVPVVVDQAWAPHFGFHPDLPPHALQTGADAMVTSAHKTLPAYSQASLVLARGDLLGLDRIDRAVDALVTTSPAGSVLASVDAARALLASPRGPRLLGRLLDLVTSARDQLRDAGLDVPATDDPTKLVVRLPGADGLAIERELIAAGMPVELAERDALIPVVTMLDDAHTVEALVSAIAAAAHRHPGGPWPPPAPVPPPTVALSPRQAFFAARATVPAAAAVGRVSAEVIAPYPPGVPVLTPGEVITTAVLDALHDARSRGARIAYAADPSLASFEVVTA